MKSLRNIIAVLVCMAMAVSVFGCSGKKSGSGKPDDNRSGSEEIKDDNTKRPAEDDGDKDDGTDDKDSNDEGKNDLEVFTGYTDPQIKMMALDYEEKGLIVEPVMASQIGASDYNYVEGFRFYKEDDPESYVCWAKFKTSDDGIEFVKNVWIKDCAGYTEHEMAGSYYFGADELYTGAVMYGGLMQYVPYAGPERENKASPEDFKDQQIIDLCRDYQSKGFTVEPEVSCDGFIAYGVNDERYHIAVICIKFDDTDKAVTYVKEILGGSSLTSTTITDNDDGTKTVYIDGDRQNIHTLPIEGTIAADGLLTVHYPE